MRRDTRTFLDKVLDHAIKTHSEVGEPGYSYTARDNEPKGHFTLEWNASSDWDHCAAEAWGKAWPDRFVELECEGGGCHSCGYGCGFNATFRGTLGEFMAALTPEYLALQDVSLKLLNAEQLVGLDDLLQRVGGEVTGVTAGVTFVHNRVQLDHARWFNWREVPSGRAFAWLPE